MAEYIERERLRELLKDHYFPTDQEYESDRNWAVGFNAGLDKALHKINYAPAADVVPVVRCKDCKHIRPEVDAYTQEVVGYWCCLLDLGSIEEKHFCSYGEKR